MSAPDELNPNASPASKLARLLRLIMRPRLARKLGTVATDGYLAQTGWIRSAMTGQVVDAAGRPQPWATFPFIGFLEPRLQREWTVFEYGAGASTLYYASRVQRVVAVEDDAAFAAGLRERLPGNARLIVTARGSDDYVAAIRQCVPAPEIVSVDGSDRVRCVAAAITSLAPGGVIIVDDAERPEYAAARMQLQQAGFRCLEFWGLAAGIVVQKCTAVFYRSGNVLGL